MRISAIQNYQSNKSFLGEKKNKLKNAAGAAALALATTAPITDAKAQYYYIPPITPITTTYTPKTVPDCFIIGDLKTFDEQKTQKQIFNEIDDNGNSNGTISVKEVLRTDLNNKIRYNGTYNQYDIQRIRNQFHALSEAYNEEDSNPNTINYNEYKAIMKDYYEANKINVLYPPGIGYPIPPLYNPFLFDGPHHHRHRDYDRPPRHHRR